MIKKTLVTLAAVSLALFSGAGLASAGILTPDSNSPAFTPAGDFNNNTIVLNTTVLGDLLDLTGAATITPDSTNQAAITISGTFSGDQGDIFSTAYSFTVDLNIDTPVSYTLSGSVVVSGVPISIPPQTGTLMPGLHQYSGTAQSPALVAPATGTFTGMLTLDFSTVTGVPISAAAGTLDLDIQQVDFRLSPTAATINAPSQTINISTRGNVGTDQDVLIGGFIITGSGSQQVVLQGLGPSLAGSGITSPVLADPTLTLYDSSGAMIATNDNWKDNTSANQMVLTDNNLAPTDDSESAIVATLNPGSYTVILSGVGATTGIGEVTAYNIDNGSTNTQFGNLSTRGNVGAADDQVLIGGISLGNGGGGFSTVIFRGLGPSLTADGVTDALADPTLSLFDANGNQIDSNDNWMDNPNEQQISDAGLAPTDPNESALYEILPEAQYTFILSGVNSTTGVGLVESYDISQ